MRKTNIQQRRGLLPEISRCLVCSLLLLLAGCSSHNGGGNGNGDGGGGNPATPPSVNVTGNWQFQSTQTSGTSTFSSLAGFLDQQGTSGSDSNFTTAALQSFETSASGCYTNDPLPLNGSVLGTQVSLRSFSVNGQTLIISANANSTGTQMSGSWNVVGGCADGAKGTLTGQEYAPVTGHYTGTVTSNPGQSISLVLTQTGPGAGDGIFLLNGTASFSGFSCFSGGSIATPNGTIIGSTVNLRITTDDPTADVVLTGTTDPTADTLNFQSLQITGGSCKGSLNGAVLKLATS